MKYTKTMRTKNITFGLIFLLSTLLCSCSTGIDSASEVEYSISNINYKVTYYSDDIAINTINISTTYVLDLKFFFDENKEGLVGYNDISFEYASEQYAIVSFPDKDAKNHLRYFITGKVVQDNSLIRIRTASGYSEDLYINIIDNIIDTQVLTYGNNGLNIEGINSVKSVADLSDMIANYPGITSYINNIGQYDESYFNRYFIAMFDFYYNVSDLFHSYKYAFIDGEKLYFDFKVSSVADSSFELKKTFFAIQVEKAYESNELIVYKSNTNVQ